MAHQPGFCLPQSPSGRQRAHFMSEEKPVVQPVEEQNLEAPQVSREPDTEPPPSEQKLDLQRESTAKFLFTLLSTAEPPEPKDPEEYGCGSPLDPLLQPSLSTHPRDLEIQEGRFLDKEDWGPRRTSKEISRLQNDCMSPAPYRGLRQSCLDPLPTSGPHNHLFQPSSLYKSLKEEGKAIQEEGKAIQEEGKAIQEEEKVVQEEEKVVQEEGKAIQEEENVIQKEEEVVQEEEEVVQEKEEVIQEEGKAIQEEEKVVQEEEKVAQEGAQAVQEVALFPVRGPPCSGAAGGRACLPSAPHSATLTAATQLPEGRTARPAA
ncbi:hypothetical protein HPG69_018434 [Diceros bicornis minor]|uniref:Uncharacterized protein n=1 Tax=Diceros bicornis minor TaxID=77932 RepID=A0A7J7FJP0_DICBM|nr:hypothetical protein HPG69_018434 [Diceros bicornis minor]